MTDYIYAYTTKGNRRKWKRSTDQAGDYWIKVGETTRPGEGRVWEQVKTSHPDRDDVEIFFHSEVAQRPDGTSFSDHDVHRVLTNAGISKAGGEWFEATVDEVRGAIVSLQRGVPYSPTRIQMFPPRPEQRAAVEQTAAYFRSHASDDESPKYLWNAKMRFGKTFATYQLARQMGWKRVLVLTYKPAVRGAWRDDLLGHVDFIDWHFIDANTPSAEADEILSGDDPAVWFASFQDATGRDPEGRPKPRNETLHIVEWDCIVIDEFHFGAATAAARELYDPQDRAEAALAKQIEQTLDQESDRTADVLVEPDFGLTTKFHLHLSGTPFKAITNGEYAEDQVFNWTYIDEQREKRGWASSRGPNPYAELAQMQMYTYAMGGASEDWAGDGEFDGFDLNTFFKAQRVAGGCVFDKPDHVASFLEMIRGKKQLAQGIIEGEKPPFPYEAAEFKDAVRHTVWYLPDVAACEAMAEMLRGDVFFSSYEIHVAAGARAKIGAAALEPMQKAIKRAEAGGKSGSITLSCGKLMTGVTVPEWTSIFMLRSLKAPESYFQAAFRVQSPWKVNGRIKKTTAYVFEFDPNRALSLVALYGTEIANNSPDRDTTQRQVLGELINFLPIFAIDGGQMEQLDTDAILDWAHGGISANSLARKWRSVDLYDLNGLTMGRLLDDPELLAELEQIEDFRNIREEAEKVVTNSEKLKKVKREGGSAAEQRKPKSEIAQHRKNVREKLKKVSAKVLVFMYLTDFREERLFHVIESLDTDLFLRSTGLSLGGFRKLTEVGVFNVSQMNDAIQKFRYFEKKSLEAVR